MKKILFITLPIDSAIGLCAASVGKQLKKEGYEVDFVTFDNTSKQIVDKSCGHYKIKAPFLLDMVEKFENKKCIKNFFYNLYRVKIQLNVYRWPLYSGAYTFKLYNYIKKLDKIKNYDCIIPVYVQIEALIVSDLIKKKDSHKIVIPYFLDSLSASGTPRMLSEKSKIKHGLWWERRLLKNADGIILMESSRKHHEIYSKNQSFWEKCVFMDIPSLVFPEDNKKNLNRIYKDDKKGALNLVYVGTFPLRIRDPRMGLKILKEALKDCKIKIYFIGPIPDSDKLIRECNEIFSIEWTGSVSHEEAIKYIQKADVVLNFGNTIAGMVPSKIFEYISYMKPIVSFSPNSADPSIPYIKRYPRGCAVIEADDFQKNINQIKVFIENLDKHVVTEDVVKKLFYKNTPECVSKYITECLEKMNR